MSLIPTVFSANERNFIAMTSLGSDQKSYTITGQPLGDQITRKYVPPNSAEMSNRNIKADVIETKAKVVITDVTIGENGIIAICMASDGRKCTYPIQELITKPM